MNKILYYTVLVYTVFSGIIATILAVNYFIIRPISASVLAVYAMNTGYQIGEVLNSNLNITEQNQIIHSLLVQSNAILSIADSTTISTSFYQFIGYESLFVVPPFILLLVMAYRSKDNEINNIP
jgi:sporulation protein YlmC with PRC-barrel domain